MFLQRLQRRRLESSEILTITVGVAAEKVNGQRLNIVATFTERRKMNLNGVQAKKQVLTKASCPRFGVYVGICGSDDTRADAAGVRGSEAFEFARFQDAQELGLQVEGNIRDLVEKRRAAISKLKAADAVRAGIGEGAFYMAKEFAFEDAFGKSSCVDRDHGFAGARRQCMEGLCHAFLPSAVLSHDQNIALSRSDALNQL